MSRALSVALVLLILSRAEAAAPFVPAGRYDDPLPAGAKARLGTTRFRASFAALSPDGAVLASKSGDKVILLTDVRTGRILRALESGIHAPDLRFVEGGRSLAV